MSWRAGWYVLKTLYSGQIAEGPVVKQFEYEFGNKFKLKNVVALNSGTSALELAYELADIGPGDEVITPVLTCTATNIPLLHRGAKIIFADINYDLNINIEDVKRKINRNTKAIVFVHFGGNNRGLRELLQICKEHKIILIEDAAQAVGSDFWGKADFTAVSLQAIKTLTSGDGGFLICKRKEYFRKAKRLRWFGYDREEKQKKGDTDLKEAGYKYHMSDITASIGLANLQSIDKVIAHRKKLAKIYNKYILLSCHAWLCISFVPRTKRKTPDWIPHSQHHYRNDKYTIFKKFKNHCPIMDEMENAWTLLPYHYGISEIQAAEIAQHALWKHKN